jgi:hypothetical protein
LGLTLIYEVFFLYLIGRVVDGNDFCLPFVGFCIAQSNAIQFLIIAFVLRSALSLYSNFKLYNYSIGYIGHLSSALGKNITKIPAKYYSSYDSTHTIYTEASQVVSNILHPVLLIMRDSIFVVAITLYIIYQYQLIAVIFFLYLFFGSVGIIVILVPRLKDMGRERQTLDQKTIEENRGFISIAP